MPSILPYLSLVLSLFLLQSCSSKDQVKQVEKDNIELPKPSEEALPIQDEVSKPTSIFDSDGFFVLKGHINKENPIFINLVSVEDGACSIVDATILYRDNNIKFDLVGEICEEQLELIRYKKDEIREKFLIDLSEYPFIGTWKKEGRDAQKIELSIDSSFLTEIDIKESFPLFKQFISEVLEEEAWGKELLNEEVKLLNGEVQNLPYEFFWEALSVSYLDRGNYEDYDLLEEWEILLIHRIEKLPTILLFYEKQENAKVVDYEENNERSLSVYHLKNGKFIQNISLMNEDKDSDFDYHVFTDRILIDLEGEVTCIYLDDKVVK